MVVLAISARFQLGGATVWGWHNYDIAEHARGHEHISSIIHSLGASSQQAVLRLKTFKRHERRTSPGTGALCGRHLRLLALPGPSMHC